MPTLIDMPSDIQYLIFIKLDNKEQRDLARTHRALTHEAQRQLFRLVCLPVQSIIGDRDYSEPASQREDAPTGPIEFPADEETLACYDEDHLESALRNDGFIEKYIWAVTNNPELAKMARTLSLEAKWGVTTVFHTRIFDVISLLPHIQNMAIIAEDKIEYEYLTEIRPLCVEWLCKAVKAVGPKSISIQPDCRMLLNKVMQIQTTKEIEYRGNIRCLSEFRGYVDPHEEDMYCWLEEVPLPNLTKFNLGQLSMDMFRDDDIEEISTLGRLCRQATGLTHFSIILCHEFYRLEEMSDSLSQRRDTLQVLEMLQDPQYVLSTNSDFFNRQINFSQFSSLKKLKLSSIFWFNQSCQRFSYNKPGFVHACEQRRGMPLLLPSSIEEVELEFRFESSIFGIGKTHRIQFLAESDKMEHYDWILDFVQSDNGDGAKPLENLKALKLVEVPRQQKFLFPWDTDSYDDIDETSKGPFVEFQPPAAVKEAFRQASVELVITLIEPKDN